MQKCLAIIGLLCCVVPVCRANAAPPAWVNDGDTNAMGRVLGSVPNGPCFSRVEHVERVESENEGNCHIDGGGAW